MKKCSVEEVFEVAAELNEMDMRRLLELIQAHLKKQNWQSMHGQYFNPYDWEFDAITNIHRLLQKGNPEGARRYAKSVCQQLAE